MNKAVVVGSGAGGAAAAKELQGRFQVTVLEEGGDFQPFNLDLGVIERLRKTGLIFDERLIHYIFPAMRVNKTRDNMVLVRGKGLGGTTTLSTGSALELPDALADIGITLEKEFAELYEEIPVTCDHNQHWNELTRHAYQTCAAMGLAPAPVPKMGDYTRCRKCGLCIFGCPHGVKWDSRRFLEAAAAKGTEIIKNCRVERVVLKGGSAVGVEGRKKGSSIFFPADIVILAAGGLSTPVILENSGLACRKSLFVDPVLCVAVEYKKSLQNRELPMPFWVKQERYMVSPYFDHLSFFYNKSWRYRSKDIFSLMVKLADCNCGSSSSRGIDKTLTSVDRKDLNEGVGLCKDILCEMGFNPDDTFIGTVNAGHPGGMLPLTEKEAQTLHHGFFPDSLFVADASLFPASLGKPPIFTIMALAKKICRLIK